MKRWPLNKAYFWETAPFFRILLPFAAGIILYERNGTRLISNTVSVLVIIAAFLLYGTIVLLKKNTGFFPAITFLLLCCILFFGGYSISYFSDIRNNKIWFGQNVTSQLSYLVRVTDFRTENETSYRLPVSVIAAIDDGKITPVHGKAFLYLYKDGPMLMNKGDSILVPGKWLPIKNAGNPFEFDYAGFCRRNNIFYRQSCSVNELRLYATNDPDNAPYIDKIHNWCTTQLETYIPDPKTKNLIEAMLLGDEVNLDEELRQSYADTGIIHIIAISGGNVAIFFVVISFLLWWMKNKKHLWIKYAIALPLVWFYVMMAGAQPSAIRAAMMFSLLALGIMLQKNNNSLNQLFATAFLLLCAQPMWLFSVGFQLSFVAVLSLILFYTPVFKWLSPSNKITRLLWGTIAASIAAEILVAPLVIYYFHTFPLLFLVANVLAYIFMSIVLVAGIAIIILSFIPPDASFIGLCTAWFGAFFNKIVVWMQSLNPPSFHFLVLTNIELIVVYTAIAGIVLFFMKKNKVALFTGLPACCLLLVLFCQDEWTNLHQQRFVVYNTGKVNHTELVNGKTFSVLHTDTANTRKIMYAIKPAHTYWQSFKQEKSTPNEITNVQGKTILMLNDNNISTGHFHVDFLVINTTKRIDPAELKEIFSPSMVIIGNSLHRKQKEKFTRDCSRAGIAIYDVSEQGAFIID